MFKKELLIDCKDHLKGRLASYVAKALLNGQRVTLVRCERVCVSGALFRNKLKFKDFKRKRTLTNPKHGPLHLRFPSKVMWRTIRGMVPHKTPRGATAMGKLKCFEGIPFPYSNRKRMVIPDALRQQRLKSHRKYTVLGDLMQQCGWKYQDLVEKLEVKRKVKSAAYYAKKMEKQKKGDEEANKLGGVVNDLKAFGY